MYSTQVCGIKDLLSDIDSMRKSMKIQRALIVQSMEKANNLLLQIEGSKISKVTETENCSLYTYNKKAILSLKKIIESTAKLLNIRDCPIINIQENLQICEQYVEFISNNIRKLLVVFGTVQQMREMKLRQDMKDNEEDEI
uniref:Uncharacterized protein n=1 Tax=Glossina brevipalpis TaxID=37001 RepID=A0A1A9WV37_9MUSC